MIDTYDNYYHIAIINVSQCTESYLYPYTQNKQCLELFHNNISIQYCSKSNKKIYSKEFQIQFLNKIHGKRMNHIIDMDLEYYPDAIFVWINLLEYVHHNIKLIHQKTLLPYPKIQHIHTHLHFHQQVLEDIHFYDLLKILNFCKTKLGNKVFQNVSCIH